MTQPSIVAHRLLAHARLCREIARESWNEEIAARLDRLAEDCIVAARVANADPPGWTTFHRSVASERPTA